MHTGEKSRKYMASSMLNQMKKQTCFFLQDKFKTARLALTDTTLAELLAEEATNNDPGSPDAKTMSEIADASFDIEDFWRVSQLLHNRLETLDCGNWRQTYKSLVLLEFLLTHGPEEFADEFQRDLFVIQDLGMFKHIDDQGFNWGATMEKRAQHIMQLLKGGQILKEERLKALKLTKDIQGFGSDPPSPSCSSTSSISSSEASRASSFGSYSTTGSIWNNTNDHQNKYEKLSPTEEGGSHDDSSSSSSEDFDGFQEAGHLLHHDDINEDEVEAEVLTHICSKFSGISHSEECTDCGGGGGRGSVVSRSFSNVGRQVIKKLYDRQFSLR